MRTLRVGTGCPPYICMNAVGWALRAHADVRDMLAQHVYTSDTMMYQVSAHSRSIWAPYDTGALSCASNVTIS